MSFENAAAFEAVQVGGLTQEQVRGDWLALSQREPHVIDACNMTTWHNRGHCVCCGSQHHLVPKCSLTIKVPPHTRSLLEKSRPEQTCSPATSTAVKRSAPDTPARSYAISQPQAGETLARPMKRAAALLAFVPPRKSRPAHVPSNVERHPAMLTPFDGRPGIEVCLAQDLLNQLRRGKNMLNRT